jgi:hypothetical protein
VLPAASLNIDLTENQKIRLSASQTLARPEYREIAPICYRAGLGEEQRCGNPDLRRTLIQNYDIRWERYPETGEIMSVALFAKHFTDPIEPRYQGRSGTNSLWFENAESATNYGVELEARRHLGGFWDRLTGITAFANATVMKSEVETGADGDEKRAMTGQAPYVVNAGITWSSAGGSTSATVLYNVVGERIINARPSGQTVLDMVEQPRPGLDLSLRFPADWRRFGEARSEEPARLTLRGDAGRSAASVLPVRSQCDGRRILAAGPAIAELHGNCYEPVIMSGLVRYTSAPLLDTWKHRRFGPPEQVQKDNEAIRQDSAAAFPGPARYAAGVQR